MLQSAIAAQQATEARHRRESRLSKSRASGTLPRPKSPLDRDADHHGDVFEADDEDVTAKSGAADADEAIGTSSTVGAHHEGEGVQRRKSRSGSSGKGASRGDVFKLSTLTKSPPPNRSATLVVDDEHHDDKKHVADIDKDLSFPLPTLDRGRGLDRVGRLSTAFSPAPSPGPASGYSTPARGARGDVLSDIDADVWSRASTQRRMSEMEVDDRYQGSVRFGAGQGEEVQEGGYGWVVTFCMSLLHMFSRRPGRIGAWMALIRLVMSWEAMRRGPDE